VPQLPNEAGNMAAIADRFRRQFEIADAAWDASIELVSSGMGVGLGKKRSFNLCMSAVTAKQLRFFCATVRLCKMGLGNEAQVCHRAMYELFLQLKALEVSADRELFARQWLLWCFANMERQAGLIAKWSPKLGPELADVPERIAELKKEVGEEEYKAFVRCGPMRESVADLATHLDTIVKGGTFRWTYDTYYPQASGPAHGYDLFDFATLRKEDDGILMVLCPSENHIDAVISSSVWNLRDSVVVIDSVWGLNRADIVKRLDELSYALKPSAEDLARFSNKAAGTSGSSSGS